LETKTIEDAVRILNEAIAADKTIGKSLFDYRVPCNQALADHTTIVVQELEGEAYEVGVIGILNGIFGTPLKRIAARFDNIECFTIVVWSQRGMCFIEQERVKPLG
jgi:hypothetical protein